MQDEALRTRQLFFVHGPVHHVTCRQNILWKPNRSFEGKGSIQSPVIMPATALKKVAVGQVRVSILSRNSMS